MYVIIRKVNVGGDLMSKLNDMDKEIDAYKSELHQNEKTSLDEQYKGLLIAPKIPFFFTIPWLFIIAILTGLVGSVFFIIGRFRFLAGKSYDIFTILGFIVLGIFGALIITVQYLSM